MKQKKRTSSAEVRLLNRICSVGIRTVSELPAFAKASAGEGGERGIRTPGPLTVNGFQDRRVRPLCHLSAAKIEKHTDIDKGFFAVAIYFLVVSLYSPGLWKR